MKINKLITLFFNAHANKLPLTQVLRGTTSQSSDDSTSWTYLAIFINFWLIIRFVIWFSFPKFNIFICLREKRKVEWIPSNKSFNELFSLFKISCKLTIIWHCSAFGRLKWRFRWAKMYFIIQTGLSSFFFFSVSIFLMPFKVIMIYSNTVYVLGCKYVEVPLRTQLNPCLTA